jgi:hypothetical protein
MSDYMVLCATIDTNKGIVNVKPVFIKMSKVTFTSPSVSYVWGKDFTMALDEFIFLQQELKGMENTITTLHLAPKGTLKLEISRSL